jgi:DNA-binding response OmpR family regulator
MREIARGRLTPDCASCPRARVLLGTFDAEGRAHEAGRAVAPTRHIGGITLDRAARAVTVGGQTRGLTRIEFDLLELLTANAGAALTHRLLIEQVWGAANYATPHTLAVHIASLRRKLGDKAGADRLIETVRGVGYRFSPA